MKLEKVMYRVQGVSQKKGDCRASVLSQGWPMTFFRCMALLHLDSLRCPLEGQGPPAVLDVQLEVIPCFP